MYNDEYIVLRKDDVEKIKNKLNILKLLVEDPYEKEKVEEVLHIINTDHTKGENESIEEVIYNKMKETKSTNPELSADLYMIYRKLQQKKIDPAEAIQLYKIYISD
ncbi:hypothetical protein [Clostridium folliculivorans]|uniref:Uncharacterized protein n=1 Tax=Clostridium folliculivorans TaxID=2886038 RepID=A0A9W6D8E1_9CLOT|nr:hypothetical protein [Clostridium folliculivorans]GKU23565.1 hypothetical protein CFOLD11_03910 [Clostridium folliculivorans]GKU29681.1 hypothetical protein CFB3_17880 [Clostridium folliculivorans]